MDSRLKILIQNEYSNLVILRKVSLGAVIISLALLLSSCVEVRGDLSVSSAARINGEIIYTLSKSLAAGVGLSSLADVKSEASTNPEAQIGFCRWLLNTQI